MRLIAAGICCVLVLLPGCDPSAPSSTGSGGSGGTVGAASGGVSGVGTGGVPEASGGASSLGTGTRYTELVDPLIGTAGPESINCFPGAVLPWGMVAVSPDTRPSVGEFTTGNRASGYLSSDELIQGFSHTRLQGTSTPDLGSVLLMPAVGDPAQLINEAGYRSTYDKASERAEPGYYAVALNGPQALAELTATRHGALHRYTFSTAPSGGKGHIVVDLGHAMVNVAVSDAALSVSGSSIEGFTTPSGRFSGPSAGGLRTYFSIQFDPAPTVVSTWKDASLGSDDARSGNHIGAIATFDVDAGDAVFARVGISYVDVEGARKNREAELPEPKFDATRKQASDAWQTELESVSFDGGTDEQRTIMATALYHSFIVPTLVTDVDGRYRGYDNAVHQGDFDYHTNFSMWDTYRTVHPLLSLVRPKRQSALTRSLIQMAREGGYYPRWSMGHGYPNITAGSPAAIVVAESFLRGATGFDADEALDLGLKEIDDPPPAGHPHSGREGLADYLNKGYVPVGTVVPGVGARVVVRTLEYAIADGALANMAERLGRTNDEARARAWSKNYERLWKPETAVFCGKFGDGAWNANCQADNSEDGLYYGANARQYAWLVPHDPVGLMNLHPTPEVFTERLSTFFEQAAAVEAGQSSSYYTHTNEPDVHAMYLFLVSGRPDLTQRWVEWASTKFYSTARNGLAGNEDAGTLSAWYVLSSIGLYPVTGTDRWLIGRPAFPLSYLAVSGGTLTIEAPGAGSLKPYVSAVTLDGKALEHPWIAHGDLEAGSVLHFEMSETPSDWGSVY